MLGEWQGSSRGVEAEDWLRRERAAKMAMRRDSLQKAGSDNHGAACQKIHVAEKERGEGLGQDRIYTEYTHLREVYLCFFPSSFGPNQINSLSFSEVLQLFLSYFKNASIKYYESSIKIYYFILYCIVL